METRKIRDLEILLPGEDADELELVDFIPAEKAVIAARQITGDMWSRMRIIDATITRCWFVNADLASSEFIGGTVLDRCVLKGCTFVGAHLTEVVLKNVIFENCRFDYATLTLLRAAGPIAFTGCSFTETVFDRCKLTPAVFDGCKLNAPSFVACDLRGADFRGNDLAKTIGVTTSFRGTVISEDQFVAFTEAVTRELELTVKPGIRP
jgi:uncharacterized protein YjbI with pentapeptide repeats